jgi:hypothetical protein
MQRFLILLIGLLLTCASASGQEFSIEPFPRIWGAGVDLLYGDLSSATDTFTGLRTVLGAAYQTKGYYRQPDDSLYDEDSPGAPRYNNVNFIWSVGIEQGLLQGPGRGSDLLTSFGYVRGRLDSHLPDDREEQLIFRSDLPDESGILQNSVVVGLFSDLVTELRSGRSRRGVYSELAWEWAPEALGNRAVGRADFQRVTATVQGFLPLYSRNAPTLDLYAATQSLFDLAWGDWVPVHARQSFGGRWPENGLGGTVRGLAAGRFDATAKAAQALELRMVLPPLWEGRIVPGIVAYLDGGYYRDLEKRSPNREDQEGSFYSTGIGVSTRLFRYATLVFYTHYLLNDTGVDGSAWTPLGIGFGYHF